MKVIFLDSTKPDLRWFKRYYSQVFPEGRSKADRQFQAFVQLLKSNPHIGHPNEDAPSLREYAIPRIPFSVLYRVRKEHIEVLRVLDQRAPR